MLFAYIRRRRAIRDLKKVLAEFPEPSLAIMLAHPRDVAKAFQYRDRLKTLITQLENNDDARGSADILLRGTGIGKESP